MRRHVGTCVHHETAFYVAHVLKERGRSHCAMVNQSQVVEVGRVDMQHALKAQTVELIFSFKVLMAFFLLNSLESSSL